MTGERSKGGAARSRAFTLIELLVGLTIGAVVLAAVTVTFSHAVQQQRAQRVRLQLARDASALNQVLTQEVRLAGLGRPLSRIAPGVAGDVAVHMLVAQQRSLGFIADVPRPDASYSTFGILHDRPAGPDRLMWHTDNNGGCAPDTTSATCSTATTSVIFSGEVGCNAPGAGNDRTCPWGSKRLRAGEFFQIVGGNGTYMRARAPDSIALVAATNPDAAGLLAFRVDTTTPFPPEWPNTNNGDAPVDIRGQGWVTTLDRVFFRYDPVQRSFDRRQCWGDFDIADVHWPPRAASTNAGTLAPGSAFNPLGVPGTECTDFEPLAFDVESVTFSYFNAQGANIGFPGSGTSRANVARVDWVIRLAKNSDGQRVFHDVVGSVRLRNI